MIHPHNEELCKVKRCIFLTLLNNLLHDSFINHVTANLDQLNMMWILMRFNLLLHIFGYKSSMRHANFLCLINWVSFETIDIYSAVLKGCGVLLLLIQTHRFVYPHIIFFNLIYFNQISISLTAQYPMFVKLSITTVHLCFLHIKSF